jgi:lipopolysaccharide/colanic/teichoic acid biosynthesis glycosyltransferase
MGDSAGADELLRVEYGRLFPVPRRFGLVVKRLVDIPLAAAALLGLGPAILLVAWLVKRGSPGGAFYVQERLGRFGRPFWMVKLRTMVADAEHQGAGLAIEAGDPRITPMGKLLRATSFDELPQLWNILRGDMSFVGPRPLPLVYLERWNERQRLRLLVPQGMGGWSQLLARNDAPWPERLELDSWYVEHWSLWLDVRIFLRTVGAVFGRRKVAAADGTVREFTGQEAADTDALPDAG